MAFVELRGVCKRFGATVALDSVDLDLQSGEVHALVGENGSGKSTLMRVLAGAIHADSGTMRIDGEDYLPSDPWSARTAGVAMIHQELALCDDLSVTENVLLGMEKSRGGWIDQARQDSIAREALERLGYGDLDLSARAGSFPISVRQTIEIARALAIGCKVIVFDEPTSSLAHGDVDRLFEIIRALREDGRTVVYISHFFDEIRRVSDRFTVLRDGRTAGSGETAKFSDDQIIKMMVGRDVSDLYPRSVRTPGEVAVSLDSISGVLKPRDASLEVRRGEVVGIAGLAGAGRTELVRAVFGLDPVKSGTIKVLSFVGPASPVRRWGQGVGMLSEDRKVEGLALGMSVAENVLLTTMPTWVSAKWEQSAARTSIEKLNIKTQGPQQPVGALSGGNQQKVALARLLAHDADVLLLDEPTRGIDVASKEHIYRIIDDAAREGKAVLMVSSYLPELLGVCDRIAVMSRGRLGPALPTAQWNQESLMQKAVATA